MLFVFMWLCLLAAMASAVTGMVAKELDNQVIGVIGAMILLAAAACFWYAATHTGMV